MDNKTILLGYVNMDWHFAMGKFSCNCTTIEDTNAFDRVICSILYRSNKNMLKSELATIIGFNVVDRPDQGRYCDRSEEEIFENAIRSLSEYGLITEDGNYLSLTELGKKSCESGTKQKIDIKEIELWVDEFIGLNFKQDMIKGLSYKPIQSINHPNLNLLSKSPLDVLESQHKELVNAQERRSVTEINCNSLSYFVASLQCEVCYNLEKQEIYASSAIESQDIDSMLLGNKLLQSRILDDFFANQQASVIYKPKHQIEMEKNILNRETKDTTCANRITHKNDFLSKLYLNNNNDEADVLFFSFYEIDDEIKQQLRNLKSDIICVDFVKGDIEQSSEENNYYIDNNICYCHINELRTSDVCVHDRTFYSLLPYVINYKGTSYSIPLVYEYSENKYNKSVLFAPFVDFILDRAICIGRNVIDKIKKGVSPDVVNKAAKYLDNIYKEINLEQQGFDTIEKVSTIKSIKKQILFTWYNSLHSRLNNLETEIKVSYEMASSRATLEEIESDARATPYDEDVFKHISEVKQRLDEEKPTKLNIKQQDIYILDTSIFIDMPNILDRFNLGRDQVVVPRAMEQEMDHLAHFHHDPEKKTNASKALRLISRKRDDYPQFLSIKNDVDRSLLPTGFDPNLKDNDMLASAIELETNDNINKVVIVSNDREFISNIHSCVDSETISNSIEGINLEQLLLRLEE